MHTVRKKEFVLLLGQIYLPGTSNLGADSKSLGCDAVLPLMLNPLCMHFTVYFGHPIQGCSRIQSRIIEPVGLKQG